MACLDEILKEFPDINADQVKTLEKSLERVKQRLIDEGRLSEVEDALRKKATQAVSEIEITAKEVERNQMLISLAEKKIDDVMDTARAAGFEGREGLAAVAVGSKKNFKDSLNSADVLGQSIEVKLLGGFYKDALDYDPKIFGMFNKTKFNPI